MILTVTEVGVTIIVEGFKLSSKEWAIHNPIRSWTLYNMSLEDIRLVLMTIGPSEIKSIRVCKKNEKSWNVLSQDLHADFFNKENMHLKHESQFYPDLSTELTSSGDKEFFVIQPQKTLQPRLHPRYELKAACAILGLNNKEFKTETIDLSEGGFHFRDIIPNWVAGYFVVVVADKYQLMCSLVEDQKEKRRVQIVSEESDPHFIQYKDWLMTL